MSRAKASGKRHGKKRNEKVCSLALPHRAARISAAAKGRKKICGTW
jgi:hypothetical protein